MNPKAKERTGYPTQKPLFLIEQIIKLVTDEGDTVFDPFCGSGTTLVAAKLLHRNFIGIDISSDAINLSKGRLAQPIRTDSLLLQIGEEEYLRKSEEESTILKLLDAIPVQRNKGIDGFLKVHFLGKPIAVKIQKPNENLSTAQSKLIKAGKARGCSLMILIATQSRQNYLFSDDPPGTQHNVLLIDSYNVLIHNWMDQCIASLSCTSSDHTSIQELTDALLNHIGPNEPSKNGDGFLRVQ